MCLLDLSYKKTTAGSVHMDGYDQVPNFAYALNRLCFLVWAAASALPYSRTVWGRRRAIRPAGLLSLLLLLRAAGFAIRCAPLLFSAQ